jgi:hypothetical protein
VTIKFLSCFAAAFCPFLSAGCTATAVLGSPDIELASSVVDQVEVKTYIYVCTAWKFEELMMPKHDGMFIVIILQGIYPLMITIPLLIIMILLRKHLHASMHPAHGGTWDWRYKTNWGQIY